MILQTQISSSFDIEITNLSKLWYFESKFLQAIKLLYSRHTNISGNIIKHNLRTSMNERTHLFINIYLTLYSRKDWCFCGVWKMGWDKNRLLYWPNFFLLTIARCVIFKNPLSTSSASWLELLNRGSLRAIAPSGTFSVCKLAGLPVSNWLNCHRHLPILFHNAHLLPLLLRLIYTGASLIDGSVKGQHITKLQRQISLSILILFRCVVLIVSGFFVLWHSNLRGLFNVTAILVEEQ